MSADTVIEFPQPEAESGFAEEARIAAAIVRDIRGGSEGAETELVNRYSRGLLYLLTRRTGDHERARDLLQETLCIAIEKLRDTEIDNPARLAGYLRGIAVRVAMNDSRKRRREPTVMDRDSVAAVPDYEPRQFERLSQQQTRDAVMELLRAMPVRRDREVLIRFYVQDEDKATICSDLGLSPLHFNRVLFRARGRLRKIVEQSPELADWPGEPAR